MYRMWIALALAGCPSDPPPECIQVDLACQPLYPPTFQNVYDQTLKDGCGSERSACHSRTGHKGNMSFESPDIAHQALLDGRVIPGDAACSEMIVRTHSPGTDYQMPPGAALSDSEQCALAQWVQAGAPR